MRQEKLPTHPLCIRLLLLRCFRPLYSLPGCPANPDLTHTVRKESCICGIDIALPDLFQEHYVEVSVQVLLVQLNSFCQGGHGQPAGGWQPVYFQSFFDLFCTSGRCQPFFFCNSCDLVHAYADGFSVTLPFVMIILFDGMGEGVPEV